MKKNSKKHVVFFWDLPFVYCHVFTYSERDGTPASKYKNSVPMLQRRTRSAHLRRLSAAKRMDFHKRHKGKHMRVLIENAKDGNFFGYTDHFLKVKLTNASEDSANRMASVKSVKPSQNIVMPIF